MSNGSFNCNVTASASNLQRTEHLTRDFNGFNVKFLHFHLGNSNSKNPIFHRSFNLIHSHVLRQPESPRKLATAAFNPVPVMADGKRGELNWGLGISPENWGKKVEKMKDVEANDVVQGNQVEFTHRVTMELDPATFQSAMGPKGETK
ncbi:hypothetical protein V6N12_006611 [Hibiscus sabdariffa]|uniref:Uncharacterized protein n=1 Tax=Hibiscus sabdariffa TaxID=183260 RepID=A0ABR2EZA8_9ROSI